jgi:transcriptional regulator NrdR family protein
MPSPKNQLSCPTCGSPNISVTDTRGTGSPGTLRRRRLCTTCGYRYSTIEISEAVFKSLVKSDTLSGHRAQLKAVRVLLDKLIGET